MKLNMSYSFERLRFHFIEHAVKRVSQDGNVTSTVITSLQQELQRGLSEEEVQHLNDHLGLLYSETDKLLRSRTPQDIPSRYGVIELWGYQQISTLHPDTYIHHEQPTQKDFEQNFVLPDGEIWAWNVFYTFTGPYYGIQTNANGQSATCFVELGDLEFVLQSAEMLKNFANCEVLGDLNTDDLDLFTLEADECAQISQTFQQQQDAIAEALSPLIQERQQAKELINQWQIPLKAAQNQGIAQFKRGRQFNATVKAEE
jgi:hypothetical protein